MSYESVRLPQSSMTQRSTDRTLSSISFCCVACDVRQTQSNQDTRALKARFFTFSFAQLEGLLLPAWALGGSPWPRPGGPHYPEAGPACFTRAGPARTGAFFLPVNHACVTSVLKVSSSVPLSQEWCHPVVLPMTCLARCDRLHQY